MDKIFGIIKPIGITSHDVVAIIRNLTKIKRVGHAGTLDPLASGVLVVGIGRNATKQLNTAVEAEKEYVAEIKLGENSSTDDEEGEKAKINFLNKPTKKDIEKIVNKFVGKIKQVPPVYSAVKIKGKEAYKRVRKGEQIIMEPRIVEIKKIDIIKYQWPYLLICVVTGKGVYIRSLARDIGKILDTGAYLSQLERTRIGKFTKEKAILLHEFALQHGGIGVIPTDTIYGIVGNAMKPETVERVYSVRNRDPKKPMIVLISSINDLKKFYIKIDSKLKKRLEQIWSKNKPTSIILPCESKNFEYLHRGVKSIAFRIPNKKDLVSLLKKVGPLVAPSANPEGEKPATTIPEAKKYFGKSIDFYVDEGKLNGKPSILITLKNVGEIIKR
jgi:tRNA pseudouridine55 synthase